MLVGLFLSLCRVEITMGVVPHANGIPTLCVLLKGVSVKRMHLSSFNDIITFVNYINISEQLWKSMLLH